MENKRATLCVDQESLKMMGPVMADSSKFFGWGRVRNKDGKDRHYMSMLGNTSGCLNLKLV